PAGSRQSSLPAHFGEVSFAVVAVEQRAGRRGVGVERSSIRDEDVIGAVAVVVKNGGAGTGAFENDRIGLFAAEGDRESQPCRSGDIDETDDGRGVSQQKRGEDRDPGGAQAKHHCAAPDCCKTLASRARTRSRSGRNSRALLYSRALSAH